jgi:hypothetical protein
LALDFFTADMLHGTKVYVLGVIEHGNRRVQVLGATEHPVQFWVIQQARNLLMDLGDAGARAKFVLHEYSAIYLWAHDLTGPPGSYAAWRTERPVEGLRSPRRDHDRLCQERQLRRRDCGQE